MEATKVKDEVKKRYGAIAKEDTGCGCCCGGGKADAIGAAVGYAEADLQAAPEGANLGLGCGNPVALASLNEGDTVVDLGSGGGFDCFLAARKVGDAGHVIGIDMTDEMLARARANATGGGYTNVEFRKGEIEKLPVDDASVDVIISNCVINLSPDKPQVFREAFRVLRPGGRIFVSDLVLERKLPWLLKRSVGLYTACVAGALKKDDYLDAIRQAGFTGVDVLGESRYTLEALSVDPTLRSWVRLAKLIPPLRRQAENVVSAKITATKPGA